MLPGQMFRIKDWFSPLPKVNNSLSILKNLGEDSSCSIFWSKKMYGPKEIVFPKKFLVPEKFLVQKKFLVQIICGRQNIWGDRKILVENVEGPRVPII